MNRPLLRRPADRKSRKLDQLMDYGLKAETGFINFSPVGFKLAAREFLRGAAEFNSSTFSILPYFLYCRAIELGLKAKHLQCRRQDQVRRDFGHDLVTCYAALPQSQRILSQEDSALLQQANEL